MQRPTPDEIRNIERTRLRSLVDPDLELAEALHADDYQLITPGGAVLSKSDYLGSIASGDLDYAIFEPASEIAVRIFDGAAVVRYQVDIDIKFSGQHDSDRFWHTDVYEYRDDRWQAVWSQATRIRRSDG